MKESDIRPRGLFEEYLRLSAEDVEQYFAKQVNRVQRSCPACSTDAPQSAFQKNGFDLVRCGECETLYVTPGPEASALAAFYTDSPSQKYWANVFFPSVAEARREMIFAPPGRKNCHSARAFRDRSPTRRRRRGRNRADACAASQLSNRY